MIPTAAFAHHRHHHRSHTVPQTLSKCPSPIDVAGGYARNAAMRLASSVNRTRFVVKVAAADPSIDGGSFAKTAATHLASSVNSTRNAVQPHQANPHEIRLARHEERLAERQSHQQEHYVRVAEQDQALRSGDIVQAANSFRGTRYIFGGTSRSGFDCSSFVRYVLANADGVDLPRTAEEQYYHGTPVDREDLQPGDLVFFKNTYRHGISHVGIYTGNGNFVHAANSHKGVREDSLDERYYAEHYAGARRVIGGL